MFIYILAYVPWSSGFETLVDQHGRAHCMDHMTRTLAFNSGKQARVGHLRADNSAELDTRREMLERRCVWNHCFTNSVCVVIKF